MTVTAQDVIGSAMSIAKDAAEGRVDLAALEQQAVAELIALAGTVAGPEAPSWETQLKVARAVLAAGGIPAGELREWTAVAEAAAAAE